MSKLSKDIKAILFRTPQCLDTEIMKYELAKARTAAESNPSMTFEFIETKPALNDHQLKYIKQWTEWLKNQTGDT